MRRSHGQERGAPETLRSFSSGRAPLLAIQRAHEETGWRPGECQQRRKAARNAPEHDPGNRPFSFHTNRSPIPPADSPQLFRPPRKVFLCSLRASEALGSEEWGPPGSVTGYPPPLPSVPRLASLYPTGPRSIGPPHPLQPGAGPQEPSQGQIRASETVADHLTARHSDPATFFESLTT